MSVEAFAFAAKNSFSIFKSLARGIIVTLFKLLRFRSSPAWFDMSNFQLASMRVINVFKLDSASADGTLKQFFFLKHKVLLYCNILLVKYLYSLHKLGLQTLVSQYRTWQLPL